MAVGMAAGAGRAVVGCLVEISEWLSVWPEGLGVPAGCDGAKATAEAVCWGVRGVVIKRAIATVYSAPTTIQATIARRTRNRGDVILSSRIQLAP